MSGFEEFFRENTVKNKEVEYKVSDRFKKSFRLKAVSEEKHEEIRNAAMKRNLNGKDEFNSNRYAYLLCAATVVYPDFNNAALQDNYGVKTPDGLMKKMLNAGEFTGLFANVRKINGFDRRFSDLKREVKNL